MTASRLELCLFGAAGDTGNMGVSALLHSILGGVARLRPGARVTVFDNGWGLREARGTYGGHELRYRLCGARLSKRYHRRESYWNMGLSARFGGLGNPGARAVLGADAVWDVSAGDSFSDLYGERTFRAITAPKELSLRHGVPLVLLPQTYGPFSSPGTRRTAESIVRRAALAWARDERSHAALRELAGDEFDPERHRVGVDLAFQLDAREPAAPLPGRVAAWLEDEGSRQASPVVGVNVSGLCYNDPEAGRRFGLRAAYPVVIRRLLRELLDRSEARILLVPHVLAPSGRIESDGDACRVALGELGPADRERVDCLPARYDQSETKWILGRLDWFTGTRMHSCIGALSSGVPAAGVAYSLKAQGVFETCGLGEHVADLRDLDEEEVLATLWASFERRDGTRRSLAQLLPRIQELARAELELSFEPGRVPAVP